MKMIDAIAEIVLTILIVGTMFGLGYESGQNESKSKARREAELKRWQEGSKKND